MDELDGPFQSPLNDSTVPFVHLAAPELSGQREAAFNVLANTITPLTGRSSRWTMPRNTFHFFAYFPRIYSLPRSRRLSAPLQSDWVSIPAGLVHHKEVVVLVEEIRD